MDRAFIEPHCFAYPSNEHEHLRTQERTGSRWAGTVSAAAVRFVAHPTTMYCLVITAYNLGVLRIAGFARPLAAAAFLGLLCLVAALEDGSHLPDASIATGGPQTLAASSSDRRGGQLPAAAEPPLDDSVRCRLAGICDSPLPACNGTRADTAEQGQDPLACINDDAGRAAAALDAARHAWSGYR